MATPTIWKRANVVIQVEFDPSGAAGVYTNLCGVTSASYAMNNEIIAINAGDCDDWTLAVTTLRSYGPQSTTISIEAQWNDESAALMHAWARDQRTLNVRLDFPLSTTTGQIDTIDGAALMQSLSIDQIGNVDGQALSGSFNLEYDGSPTVALVA